MKSSELFALLESKGHKSLSQLTKKDLIKLYESLPENPDDKHPSLARAKRAVEIEDLETNQTCVYESIYRASRALGVNTSVFYQSNG